MVEPQAIGMLVIQGGAESAVVARTVEAMAQGGSGIEIRVLPSATVGGDGLQGMLPSSITVTGRAASTSEDIVTELGRFETPFVGATLAGDVVHLPGLHRRVEALQQRPELVLATCGTTDDVTELGVGGGRGSAVADAVDGRQIALRSLVEGGDELRHPSSILFRRAALGSGTADPGISARTDGGDWCLRLSLALLVSGGAWVDPIVGAVVGSPDRDDTTRRLEEWPRIIELAGRLGLKERGSTATDLLVAHTRRVAAISQRDLVGGDRIPISTTSVIQTVNALWQSEDRIEAEAAGQLNLHVVVCSAGGEHDAATISAAKVLARQVSVVGPQASAHASTFGIAEVPRASPDDSLEDVLHHLASTTDIPVLILNSGELPKILDRSQIVAFLKQPEWSAAVVCTPSGWHPRLWNSTQAGPERMSTSQAGPTDATGGHPVVQSIQIVSVGTGESADWWLKSQSPSTQEHLLRRFVIAAPDYTDIHGGVVAMHRLCDRLNQIGYEAYIEPLGEATGVTRPGWRTPLWWRQDFEGTVIIYPEIVTGNPLGAPRVVRWLLNRPMWFTGFDMSEDTSDLIVSFSPQIAADVPVLTIPLIDPTVFFPKDVEGRGGLLWIGKGTVPPEFDRGGVTLITDTWPKGRRAMAELLRRADVLYTCDWLTTIIGEALMCGTPVVLIGDQSWERGDISMWPGMMWEGEGDLLQARQEAARFADDYRSAVGWSDQAVEQFVEAVNLHFIRHPIDPPAEREPGPTLPTFTARISAGVGSSR